MLTVIKVVLSFRQKLKHSMLSNPESGLKIVSRDLLGMIGPIPRSSKNHLNHQREKFVGETKTRGKERRKNLRNGP